MCHSKNGLDASGMAGGRSWPGEPRLRLLEENKDVNVNLNFNDK